MGSKEGNIPAGDQGDGKSGMQPFVRGDDLQDTLALIIDQIAEIAFTLQTNGMTGLNISPGNGLANPGLEAISSDMTGIIESLSSIQKDLPKFKSS